MTPTRLEYQAPPGISITALDELLRGPGKCRAEGTVTLERAYYDSYDWRLARAGRALEAERSGRLWRLEWRSLGAPHAAIGLRVASPPRFAAELPDGALRESLGALLDVRALIERAKLSTTRRAYKLLNRDGKTVLRAAIERHRAARGGRSRRGRIRLILYPVRGYGKPLEKMQHLLARSARLTPVGEDLYLCALALSGVHIPAPAPPAAAPEPHSRTDEGVKRLLADLVPPMRLNARGIAADVDTECLHDFRVAVRRTRSLLKQAKGVLPARTVQRFRERFKWIGDVTSGLRDLDVHLLSLPDYERVLEENERRALAPLRHLLASERGAEHARVARAIGSLRLDRLLGSWERYLAAPCPAHTPLPKARPPMEAFAAARIAKAYARVIEKGRAIGPHCEAWHLHELRKLCKVLRYLLEFFGTFYPDAELKGALKALKGLQDNLGEFQDLAVHARALGRLRGALASAPDTPPATPAALDTVIERMRHRQRRAREEFAARFSSFDGERTRFLSEKATSADVAA